MSAAALAIIRGNENAPARRQSPGARPNGGNPMDTDERSRWRGPYNRSDARPFADRLADRFCPQPPCKCGCGEGAIWRATRGKWGVYASGHYRKASPYKSRAWLQEQYVERRRTLAEIAEECGVCETSVTRFARQFGIPIRDRSDARIGRQAGSRNPAWKGGVADWDYASGWKVIARRIRDRDQWTCQLCHEQRKRWGKNLHVHHIDGDKLNNDPLNLISVCAGCHPRGKDEDRLASQLRELAACAEGVI